MFIITARSGETLDAVILPMEAEDFIRLAPPRGNLVHFDWISYKKEKVYKICLTTSEEILGAICIREHPEDDVRAIEIVLIESSLQHTGSKKQYDGIAGCLIAFACRMSFQCGYEGCVFLIPKTTLVSHYTTRYGFFHIPLRTTIRP